MRSALLAIACFAAALVSRAPADERKAPPASGAGRPEPFQAVQTLKTEADVATAVAFSPDRTVVAVGDGQQVRFWDVRTGKTATDAWTFKDGVAFIAFIGADKVAITGGTKIISIREYPSGKSLATLDLKTPPTVLVANTNVVVCGGQRILRLWDVRTERELWHCKLEQIEYPTALGLSPDGTEVAFGTDKVGVRVFSVADGKELRANSDNTLIHRSGPCAIAFSPDGRLLAAGLYGADPESRRNDAVWGLNVLDAGTLKPRHVLRWGESCREPLGCAFTPDGKTLVIPTRESSVRLYEVETGKLRHIGGFPLGRFAMSPDGRRFATASTENTISIVDWRAAKPGTALTDAALAGIWADLASPDGAKGFKAVIALGTDPKKAAKLIGEKLKPVPVPKAEAVKAWVADLGSDDFATREAAEKELAKLGDAVEAELREAARSDVPERRDRAGKLLKALSRRDSPERLRILRAIEVLEYADTPAGRDVLKTLAGGAPSALLTRDAKAALARLQAFDPKP